MRLPIPPRPHGINKVARNTADQIGLLSPLRLPVSPPGHVESKKITVRLSRGRCRVSHRYAREKGPFNGFRRRMNMSLRHRDAAVAHQLHYSESICPRLTKPAPKVCRLCFMRHSAEPCASTNVASTPVSLSIMRFGSAPGTTRKSCSRLVRVP